ncbi:MAG: PqqD family peptide modification chaperone [Methanospirillum sp.]|nr:PqqD family peptide modification chaperone [Methanospirillum sp.]
MVKKEDVPVPSSNAVFREEFDEWGLLFDPDTGEVDGVNPVGAFIWKHLDGRRSVEEIVSLVASSFEEVPETAPEEIYRFIEKLAAKGFVAAGAG